MSTANDTHPIVPVPGKRSTTSRGAKLARIVFWITVAAAIPLSRVMDMGTNALPAFLVALLLGVMLAIGVLVEHGAGD